MESRKQTRLTYTVPQCRNAIFIITRWRRCASPHVASLPMLHHNSKTISHLQQQDTSCWYTCTVYALKNQSLCMVLHTCNRSLGRLSPRLLQVAVFAVTLLFTCISDTVLHTMVIGFDDSSEVHVCGAPAGVRQGIETAASGETLTDSRALLASTTKRRVASTTKRHEFYTSTYTSVSRLCNTTFQCTT